MRFTKILAVLTAVSALIGGTAFPASVRNPEFMLTASAETTGTYQNLTYTLYNDHVVITKFDNTVADVVIPEKIELTPVTEIGAGAFQNATRLKTIKLPDSIIKINDNAFNTVTALEYITLPENLQVIGNNAFYKCISLKEITLPESINSLGSSAFQSCVSMQTAIINGTMVSLPDRIFSSCSSLKEVYIPLGITNLNNSRFYQSDLPACSFYNCEIQDVYYEGSQIQWNSIGNTGIDNRDVKSFAVATIHYGSPNPPKKITPDLNEDGFINAADAAVILRYAAYVGANGETEMQTFLELDTKEE